MLEVELGRAVEPTVVVEISHQALDTGHTLSREDRRRAADERADLSVGVHVAEVPRDEVTEGRLDGAQIRRIGAPLIPVRVQVRRMPARQGIPWDVVMDVDEPRQDHTIRLDECAPGDVWPAAGYGYDAAIFYRHVAV